MCDPLRGRICFPSARILKKSRRAGPAFPREIHRFPALRAPDRSQRGAGGEASWRHEGGAARPEDFLETKLDRYFKSATSRSSMPAADSPPIYTMGTFAPTRSSPPWPNAKAGISPGSAGKGKGARNGWWGMSEGAEAFLDQLITWREVGFNAARFLKDYANTIRCRTGRGRRCRSTKMTRVRIATP